MKSLSRSSPRRKHLASVCKRRKHLCPPTSAAERRGGYLLRAVVSIRSSTNQCEAGATPDPCQCGSACLTVECSIEHHDKVQVDLWRTSPKQTDVKRENTARIQPKHWQVCNRQRTEIAPLYPHNRRHCPKPQLCSSVALTPSFIAKLSTCLVNTTCAAGNYHGWLVPRCVCRRTCCWCLFGSSRPQQVMTSCSHQIHTTE